jgi:glycosyltransferase involved in cell wall biosynthesis
VSEPLVSVITVVLNDREGLSATLDSVRAQDHPGIEHVAIDGGSSDGSAELLKERSADLAHAVSEPDRGISDAFNKGLAAARGQWINFLNAGDTFEDEHSVSCAAAHFGVPAVVTGFSRFGESRLPRHPCSNRNVLTRRAKLSHQASFVHRDIFEACGHFDTDYAVRMDYEFFLRALARFDLVFVDAILARFELGGISSQSSHFFAEELRANHAHVAHPRLVNGWTRLLRARAQFLGRSGLRRLWRAWRGR